jgi:4-amino-4-deoxy-L-arabinose transferase-like glycosyltransferase
MNLISERSKRKILPLAALTGIVILAAVLRFTNIDSLGYVNHYYAAAVKSMLQSWHNFFFVVAEPGGSVSVDKPPVGLWLQAISAYFLGVNTLGLLMPQILAGLASVVLVYHLVGRKFGAWAGLIAAFALAVTPVAVAVDRNNTIDSTMLFTLLLATWAFIKATESGKMRYLALGAILVGVAFNIKMMAAFLPVPAFFALYFFGAREGLWRKIGKLAIAFALLMAVSFSWAVAVDLTPANQRPYVGSSTDNSEMTLIVGYNGINRLVGMNRNRGGMASAGGNSEMTPSKPDSASASDSMAAQPGNPPSGNGNQPNGQDGNRPQGGPGGSQMSAGNRPQGQGNSGPGSGGPGGGGTPSNVGQKGILRLFTSPLDKETSWLLPVALLAIALLLTGTRFHFPLEEKHQALVLWGGWLVTGGVFFSVASYFHEYYLTLLAAPLAALVGIGIVELWRMREEHPMFAGLSAIAITGITLAFQYYIAASFVKSVTWLLPTLAACLLGILLLAIGKLATVKNLMLAGAALLVMSMFVTPTVWSYYTAMNPGSNLSLPAAYSGRESGPSNRGSVRVNQNLVDYLEANTQETTYLMAVPSSMQGADYVLATGRPVLYIGGFKGSDQVVDAEGLAQLVQDGELRYVYWGAQGMGGNSEIASWLKSACEPVQGYDTTTQNAGAPDGTTAAVNVSTGNAITLYDCGK